mmetsp:Transcript_27252/g.83672  ORF Transcript_27252/g.83672 Transcript_27252/m.83672 type:complete len:121 (-) Transcript_27252:1286-1648(-)
MAGRQCVSSSSSSSSCGRCYADNYSCPSSYSKPAVYADNLVAVEYLLAAQRHLFKLIVFLLVPDSSSFVQRKQLQRKHGDDDDDGDDDEALAVDDVRQVLAAVPRQGKCRRPDCRAPRRS